MSTSGEPVGADVFLRVRAALSDLFELHDVTISKGGALQLRGRLLRPAEEAYAPAAKRLQPLGYTLLFRRRGEDDIILAVPGLLQVNGSRNGLGVLLFLLTAASMVVTNWNPYQGLAANLLAGGQFMASLLAILTAHELGHFFVGRHFGVPLSLPYFIPMPFLSPFGTMGAFIRLKAPPTNRRVLLAIAVAGPLAGLALALPLLFVGLKLSDLGPILTGQGAVQEGNSLLYAAAKFLVFGRWLPGGGVDVYLHPVAFAAWAGLFVTGLNLIPAGQLDGGHVAYALIGERARHLTLAIIVSLLLMGLVWPGWLLWSALLFFLGRSFATPLDDITRLDRRRLVLAVAMLVVFVLIFTPIPLVEL